MVPNRFPMNPAGVQLSSPIELVGGGLVERREHHPDARQHGVEPPGVERQVLGVGLDPVELGAALRGELRPDLQQAGREVAGGHPRAGERGRDGGVAGARRDVEDLLPGPHPGGLDE